MDKYDAIVSFKNYLRFKTHEKMLRRENCENHRVSFTDVRKIKTTDETDE